MSTFSIFLGLTVIICFLLILVVMVQNPKGGGLSSAFGGSSQQLGGVQKTTDFLDRSTWVLAALLLVLILISNSMISLPTDGNESTLVDESAIEEVIQEEIPEEIPEELPEVPHLLVAGTTGSGKSVGVNAMLLSLLYHAPASRIRLILIDPKMLELSIYEGIPHLLTPVVIDMKLAANALHWCVGEMERRYRLMSRLNTRNLSSFNQKVADALRKGKPLTDPLAPDDLIAAGEAPLLEPLPQIVVVIDELADLMMVVGKKVEELIARLAQKARAAGIHLILATQRPSVDVITGLIKANIPARISFQVSSKIDSRTVLDQMAALIGSSSPNTNSFLYPASSF